ncbi:MAG: hypothetical protein JWM99_1457 [Verrucomicrobiales bacterium]|nr:hypothetical protein [Verrucomicrobiales bacterium]
MHFSRLIRFGCVSGLAASPILAQNLSVSVEPGNTELHESAGNAGAPMSVREQLVARIATLRTEGKLTAKQAEHLRSDVEYQISQAEKSRDSLRIVSAAGQLETRIDATAGAAQALQVQAQGEAATRRGLDAVRQFEAKVAIARSRREAQLTAEALLAEGARRERQAQRMQEFTAIQSARLDVLSQKTTSPAAVEVTSKADSLSQIAVIPAKPVEALHAEPSGPEKISPAVVVETAAVKETSEVPAERSHVAGSAPTPGQIEKLQAAALEVLHAQQAGTTKPSATLVAENTLASPSSPPVTAQPPVMAIAPSVEQVEKLQAAALEVLHAQQAETRKASATLVAQNAAVNPSSQTAATQPPAAASAPSAEQIEKLQAAALEALHSQPAPVAAPPAKKPVEKKSNKVRTTPETTLASKFAKPAEAPADAHERAAQELREKMQKPVTAANLNDAQIAKGQERAIEVLHESTPAVVPTVAKVETEKELQQRAREIVRQQKAEAEQARIAAKNADASVPSKTSSDSTTTAQVDPAVLERARAILREHQASEKTNSSVSAPPAQPATQSQTALPKLDPNIKTPVAQSPAPVAVAADAQPFRTSLPPASDEALERARAELRQKQSATAASTPVPATAVLSSSVPAEAPGSGLNEKTRRLLIRQNKELEKSAGKTATPAPASDSGQIDPYARAREVLRNQPNSTKDAPVSPSIATPSTSAPASPAIVVVTPPAAQLSAPVQAAPAALPSTVITTPQPPSSPDRSDAVLERAREILRQQKASNQTVTGNAAPPAVAPAPAAPTASQPTPPLRTEAPAEVDTAVVHARALEALHAQENAEKKSIPPVATKPVPPAEKPVPVVKAPAVAKPAPAVESTPIVQAAPAAKTKKEKLADLLELYKADKITPGQYQEERAKIIAEP